MGSPLAIAHRGDPFAFRENTLPALAAAVEQGADMVEIDVRRTADGGVAVLHDPTLRRLWGVSRALAELSLAEAQAIGVPSFREVLAAVQAPLMVDFEEDGVAAPALAEVEQAGALDRCLFSGGNVGGHRLIRGRAPEARIALTWTERVPPPEALLDELEPELFNPPYELVDPDVVAAAHERGLGVSTWTVDDPAEMARVLEAGVDAVITNRVAALVALLAEDARC